jgi:YHS domain-containing protein
VGACGLSIAEPPTVEEETMRADDGGVAVDPICGKPVIEADAEELEYKRRRYFFCSGGCRASFEKQAERIHVNELAKLGTLFTDRKASWGVA